jgi:hypothetical protein
MEFLEQGLIALNVRDYPEFGERRAFRNLGHSVRTGWVPCGGHFHRRAEGSAHFGDLVAVRSHNRVVQHLHAF